MINGKPFNITSITRFDLGSVGFETENVDDATMEQLASKMGSAYMSQGFWIDLEILAKALNIPKKVVVDKS